MRIPVPPLPRMCALVLAALVTACAVPSVPDAAIRPGLYRQRALLCTPAMSDAGSVCAPQLQDCLLIQAAPGPGAPLRVELFSTQANQHVCVVSASARPDHSGLRVDDPDTPGQGLRITRDGDALRLAHLAPARPGLHPFCGARASLDGYRFSLSSWQAVGGACVPTEFK